MSRIACLRIPKFPIAVHLKIEPLLRSKPFVLLNKKNRIVICSREAEKKDLQPGMSLTEARVVCSQLIWREFDDKLYEIAQKKLARELIYASPRVIAIENGGFGSDVQAGFFLLDVEGFEKLGGEAKFCRDVLRLVSRHGYCFDCRVGVADSAFAARLASSSKTKRWWIVTEGRNLQFLAPLPIDYLPVSRDLKDSLKSLGMVTIGQFAALPLSSLIDRFDEQIAEVHSLALGKDNTLLSLPTLERKYECLIDFGFANDSFRDIQLVLKNMLERLTLRLRNDGLVAEELKLCFFNANEKFEERPVKLIRPSNHSKFLLDVLRLSLEANPLKQEFTALQLSISYFSRESFEQTKVLLEKKGDVAEGGACDSLSGVRLSLDRLKDSSESMIVLLQKVSIRFGEEALVKPVVNDQYFPEQSGYWVSVNGNVRSRGANAIVPVNSDYTNQYFSLSCLNNSRKDSLMPGLVLKRHEPSVPVFVQFKDKDERGEELEYTPRPQAVAFRGRWYHVKGITLPENLSGLWWDAPVRKSYYVAVLEMKREAAFLGKSLARGPNLRAFLPSLITVLLVFDHELQGWFVEGVFD